MNFKICDESCLVNTFLLFIPKFSSNWLNTFIGVEFAHSSFGWHFCWIRRILCIRLTHRCQRSEQHTMHITVDNAYKNSQLWICLLHSFLFKYFNHSIINPKMSVFCLNNLIIKSRVIGQLVRCRWRCELIQFKYRSNNKLPYIENHDSECCWFCILRKWYFILF